MTQDQIKELRKAIDSVDTEILNALNKRIKLVAEFAEYKRKNNVPFYCPEREAEIIENLCKKNPNKGYNEEIEKIYKTIFSVSHSIYLKQDLCKTLKKD